MKPVTPSIRKIRSGFSSFINYICLSVLVVFATQIAVAQGNHSITTQADFERAMEQLSNWGRWGDTDEKGASNLITPEKIRQAAALVQVGITVSLAHDVNEERGVDASSALKRTVLRVSPTGASDQYQYDGMVQLNGRIDPHATTQYHLVEGGDDVKKKKTFKIIACNK